MESRQMKENVLEVLLYLFDNYLADGGDYATSQDVLTAELNQAGFSAIDINNAFSWLEDLSSICEQQDENSSGGHKGSMRYLLPEERERLGPEAFGLMLTLENAGILDPLSREMVLERVMALEVDEMDLEQFKWVILMVLCNRQQPINEDISWTEAWVQDGISAHLH